MYGSTAKAREDQAPAFTIRSSSSCFTRLHRPWAEKVEAHVSEERTDFSPIRRKVCHALLQRWSS